MAEHNVMDSPAQSAPESYEVFGGSSDGGEDFGQSSGGDNAPGMGQSKSSRRRRRKRKGKVTGTEAAGSDSGGESSDAPAPFVMAGESLALAAAAPSQNGSRRQQGHARSDAAQAASAQNGQNGAGNGQPQGQSQGQGGKRWKKKFRDRERRQARSENPGNDFRAEAGSQQNFGSGQNFGNNGQNFGNNGGGGFKRRNKGGGGGNGQRRERTFVGPMDHSYREVNGNFAEAPPSTIQLHHGGFGGRKGGRHHGDSQPIDHNMPRAIPIPENAQTHIYFFIEDLFFIAKIQEMARKQGVKVAFVKNDKESLDALTSGEDQDKPALIVFDLNNASAKPLTLIPKLRTKLKKSASIIGFLSHLQGDLKAKATEAGCDTVMPRAAFSQNLPNLLRRYSVEEAEEINYNQ